MMHDLMQRRIDVNDRHTHDKLMQRATALTGTWQRGALLRDALKVLIERQSARRLANLGGNQIDLAVPPRRRGAP